MIATLLGLRAKANKDAFTQLMDAARAAAPSRCEICAHWGAEPDAKAPRGWKRCKLSDKATSPLFSCGEFEPAK